MTKIRALYGTWSSPITPKLVGNRARINDVQWAGDALVWHESRGTGNTIISQRDGQAPRELGGDLVGSGKIAYGGGEFGTIHDSVFFVARDGRLYRTSVDGGAIRPVTPGFGGAACPIPAPDGTRLAYIHTYEDKDGLALIDLTSTAWPRKLDFSSDFAMNPVWSPDGTQLAWVAYDMPNMPWDATRLMLLTFAPDGTHTTEILDGRAGGFAVGQPTFSPDGKMLAYLSDESGLSQIILLDLVSRQRRAITSDAADYSGPGWVAGLRYVAWLPDSRHVLCRRSENAHHTLWLIDSQTGIRTQLLGKAGYSYFGQVTVRASDGRAACIASATDRPQEVISFYPVAGAPLTVHARSLQAAFESGALSVAQPMQWRGADGETVYGLYYPPASARFESDGLPPLIVHVHGGPTSQAFMRFEPDIQFWATRGYAVMALNFRGSTGYGRAYMQRLYGDWGGCDVDDAVSAADFLGAQGLVDRAKCVIYGGSSGGYAVLRALTIHVGKFAAGVNLYGVADQFALVRDTHKFERAYSDMLLGKLPQAAKLYRERSPLFFADSIRDPLIVFQGADDTVVPQNQSDAMVAAIRANGIEVEYHIYAGEGHGFRKPDTIDHYLKSVQAFLERVIIYG
jgi:dipeptidyl aminopeptidase/acylaminoacyl peptidase